VVSSDNIVWHRNEVDRTLRNQKYSHRSAVVWLTGLSGSGKSTLAAALEKRLFNDEFKTYVLDGDNIRHGLNKDLGFSPEERKENIRRTGEVSKLFVDAGLIVITAFISPYVEDRNMVRQLFDQGEFIEVFVDCPLEVCESRDPKGLYRLARNGKIPDFTGISAPYERPQRPELVLKTDQLSLERSVDTIYDYMLEKGILR